MGRINGWMRCIYEYEMFPRGSRKWPGSHIEKKQYEDWGGEGVQEVLPKEGSVSNWARKMWRMSAAGEGRMVLQVEWWHWCFQGSAQGSSRDQLLVLFSSSSVQGSRKDKPGKEVQRKPCLMKTTPSKASPSIPKTGPKDSDLSFYLFSLHT